MMIVRGWDFSEVVRDRHAAAGVNKPRMFVERNQREYSCKPANHVTEVFEYLDEQLVG